MLPIADENIPVTSNSNLIIRNSSSTANAIARSKIELSSPKKASSRKHRNSSFLHRIRFRKGSCKDKVEETNKDKDSTVITSGTTPASIHDDAPGRGLTSTSSNPSAGGIKRFKRGALAKKYKALSNDATNAAAKNRSNSKQNKSPPIVSDPSANVGSRVLKELSNDEAAKQDTKDRGLNVSKVKKRKSNEGSQEKLHNSHDATMRICRDPIDHSPTISECSDQKRYRSHKLSMPPVETLDLNCNEDDNRRCSSLTGSPMQEDMNSSLSSNSPMAMEVGAFSSLYYHGNGDEEDGDRALNFNLTRSYNRQYNPDPKHPEYNPDPNHPKEQEKGGADNDNDDDSEDIQDDSEEDSESNASTVVNSLPRARLQKPPPGATKEEQDRFYWELCYSPSGDINDTKVQVSYQKPPISRSANRKISTKSCLSVKKTPWTEIANSASKRVETRRRLVTSAQGGGNGTPVGLSNSNTEEGAYKYSTPQGNDTDLQGWSSQNRNVKFGESSAAEFESSRPTVELTPLPAEQARDRFRVDEPVVKSDEESVELHQETARNADMLNAWEDDFDSFCEDDWDKNDSIISMEGDSDGDEPLEALIHRKRLTSRGSGRKSNANGNDRDRRDISTSRRSSTFFSKEGGSLLNPNEIEEDTQRTKAPGNVCINTNSKNAIPEIQGNRASVSSRESSLQFSSPSTVGESFLRLSSSGSEGSKVTPTTDLTSSSIILRSMHSAGGASIGRDAYSNRQDESQQNFKPSQLDFALQKTKNFNSPLGIRTPAEQGPGNSTEPCDLLSRLTADSSMVVDVAELLTESKTNYTQKHKISSILAIEGSPSYKCSSLLDITSKLDEQVNSSQSCVCDNGVADVVKMSVALMEENTANQDDVDEVRLASILEDMAIHLEESEIEYAYAIFAEHSNVKWLEQEMEALQAAKNWLLPLYKSNCEEELNIVSTLSRIEANCLEPKKKREPEQQMSHNETKLAVCELEETIVRELNQLELIRHQAHFLTCICELELSKPIGMLKSRLLETLIPYDCHVQPTPLIITYPHLDRSQTLVSWDSTAGSPNKPDKRESICTTESTESTVALLMTTPKTKRLKIPEGMNHQVLPEKSVARRLYCRFLDSEYMKHFISEQFQLEHELGIMTLADAFQRLNLLALDVLELQKYYSCRLEMPAKSNLVLLQVIISLGQLCSIAVRFTYDTSSPKTQLCPVPSDVFVEPISGEPAVPTKVLLQVAKHTLSSNAGTNAFLLRRTCSAIVDSLTKY
eukprot:scaffold3666_cov268-Chaetoceros_neogracile.AAC.19